MIIAGDKVEIGDVFIKDSTYVTNKKEVNTNQITIVSKDKKYELTFWTIVPSSFFNTFPLNEKMDIIKYVDDYDIDLAVDGTVYLNSCENTHIYFTKLEDSVFQLNIEIAHPGEQSVFIGKKDPSISHFELEAVIDFTKVV